MEQQAVVRNACVEDYPAIHRLNSEAFGYQFPLEQTQERLRTILEAGRDKLFVAQLGDRVVGYVHGADYDCTYSQSLKNILAIAVEPGLQGKGVGRSLLDALEQWAEECGCCGVRLVSGENRQGAHQFYRACGYTLRKTQKNFIKYFE